jgi:S-adenosylmethionine decarboxylase
VYDRRDFSAGKLLVLALNACHLNPLKSTPPTSEKPVPLISGLHVVANFAVQDLDKLVEFQPFRAFIEKQIDTLCLTSVGEVYHNFPGGGFTGVVCLTESHLSVHTWPEQGYVTFDVFLSNYLKDNRAVTRRLYDAVCRFFDATVLWQHVMDR